MKMRYSLAALVWLIAVVCLGAQTDPWARLQFKTAWILAGIVDIHQFDDMLIVQPVLRRPNQIPEHKYRLVNVGDVATVINPAKLLIRDFAKSGERFLTMKLA
jgi:hypothetical protein